MGGEASLQGLWSGLWSGLWAEGRLASPSRAGQRQDSQPVLGVKDALDGATLEHYDANTEWCVRVHCSP